MDAVRKGRTFVAVAKSRPQLFQIVTAAFYAVQTLIRAAVDAEAGRALRHLSAQVLGGATAVSSASESRLTTVEENSTCGELTNRMPRPSSPAEKQPGAISASSWLTMFQMLATAISRVGSTDALKVGRRWRQRPRPGRLPVEMRAEDHQLLMPYYAVTFTKNVKYDSEKTGLGWKTDFIASTEELTLPTTCKMKRPTS
jgi:branched-chain amino acid transport system substrate-binding protein